MNIKFFKYQGTGNDFILVEDWDKSKENILRDQIKELCLRKFGIGADGFIFIQACQAYDFYMKYYNSDGRVSSMCGNGGRCVISLTNELGITKKEVSFLAADGPHTGFINHEVVHLKMRDVNNYKNIGKDYFIDTGSPHYIRFIKDIASIDVYMEGKKIRYSERFREKGVNVNFVEIHTDKINIATYERGVEGETLSCGTGVTAAALASKLEFPLQFTDSVKVMAKGGKLEVKFDFDKGSFSDVWLCGPVVKSFEGIIII